MKMRVTKDRTRRGERIQEHKKMKKRRHKTLKKGREDDDKEEDERNSLEMITKGRGNGILGFCIFHHTQCTSRWLNRAGEAGREEGDSEYGGGDVS